MAQTTSHPALSPGRVAVITGAANGIGQAAALELARLGLKVAIADVDNARLEIVGKQLVEIVGEAQVLVVPTDVTKIEQVEALRDQVYQKWNEVSFLLNNAAIGTRGTSWEGLDAWKTVFNVNVFGVVNVQHTFAKSMLKQDQHSIIVNTGSKQGITNPPGNTAYNATKAAVKSLTEGLAHELRNQTDPKITAHLFIPGWTFTGMTGLNTASEKPSGAWSAQQTVSYMLDKVQAGDFYILVPDNETTPELDRLRAAWAGGDVSEGRPALSRWHKDYKTQFEDFIKKGVEL